MDIRQFSQRVAAKQRQIAQLLQRRLPVVVGRLAKNHYQDNFRQGGFVNGGLHPWPKAKRLSSGRTDAAGNYGTLLSGDKHLFNAIKYIPSDYRVKVSNELVYAPIHNWGGTVSVTVTERMRRFAWAKFREANGKTKKNAKGKKNSSKKATAKQMVSPQAAFWRNLALTKKKKLTIRIPQRQFLGESKELNDKINERIEKEIRNVLN